MKLDSLARLYSSKSDDELLALAAEPESLVEEARRSLEFELRQRNLEKPSPSSVGSTVARPEPPSGITRPLRFASGIAVFLVSVFFGAVSHGAFLYDHRLHLLTPGKFSFLLSLASIVTVLSFVGAYLLVVGAVRSK